MTDHITIGDITPRIQYTADGAQTQFTYPFPVFEDADLEVYEDATLKTLTTHYTVAGAGDDDGGTVTFLTAPADGVVVTLRRNVAIKRTTDFQEAGEFRAKVINDELDKLAAGLQQVETEAERGLKLSPTDTATAMTLPDKATRASKFLGFDGEGDPIASAGTVGENAVPVSAYAETLLDDADAAAARSTLVLGPAAVEAVAAGGSGDLLRADGDGSSLTGIQTADHVARANILLNAFRIAVNGGLSVQNMVDGVVDEFEDETGVDTAASTNETYDASGDYYHTGSAGYGADLITGGETYSASHGANPGNAADGSQATYWQSGNQTGDVWWKVDFGAGNEKAVTKVAMDQFVSDGVASNTTYVEGSNNDSDWMTLHTEASEPATNNATYTFEFGNAAAYRYVRVRINRGVLGNLRVEDFQMHENLSPQDMTLISEATTAQAQPDEVFIVVWEQDVDSVTLNTDLKAWASRDGGTTWTQITLSEDAGVTTGRVLTGTADISGQPAGSSMKWKLTTHNTKEQRILGVGLQWS